MAMVASASLAVMVLPRTVSAVRSAMKAVWMRLSARTPLLPSSVMVTVEPADLVMTSLNCIRLLAVMSTLPFSAMRLLLTRASAVAVMPSAVVVKVEPSISLPAVRVMRPLA